MPKPAGYRGVGRWPVIVIGGVAFLGVFGAGVGCTMSVLHAIGGVSAVAAPSAEPLHPQTAFVPQPPLDYGPTPFPEPTRAPVSVAVAQAAAKVVLAPASARPVQAATIAPEPAAPVSQPHQVAIAATAAPQIHRAAVQVQFTSRDKAQDAQAQADLASAGGGPNPAATVGGYVRPSQYELGPQDFIAARLTVDVNSERPGQVLAVVIAPIYDSATHTTLLIPAGTMLRGDDGSGSVSNGQSRLVVAWRELIFPNEVRFIFPGQAEGADAMGAAGTPGDVDTHQGRAFGSALLYTLLSAAGNALGNIGNHSQVLLGSSGGGLGTLVAQQARTIQPTVSIPQGTIVHVYATRPLALRPYAEISHD